MLCAMYTVVLKRRAEKQYNALPAKDRAMVLAGLQGLREDPFSGKKLQGDLFGLYSLRVWPYRIIYSVQKRTITVTVVAIGQRKDVSERRNRSGNYVPKHLGKPIQTGVRCVSYFLFLFIICVHFS